MRAFRALRALRPEAALRLLPRVRRVQGLEMMRTIRRLTKSSGKKRAIVKRLVSATLSAAATFSLIPISYALSTLWPEGMSSASALSLRTLGCVPANAMSRWFGRFADSDRIPYFAHQRLIKMLIKTYGIDISEVEHPLEQYHTLQEFFSRRLRPNSRPPHPLCPLVSPCDAEVLQVGRMTSDDMILQVKGDTYAMSTLMQTTKQFSPRKPGFDRIYFLFHLRPRDYHRFHSPADIEVLEAAHVPGTLHPVTYASSKWIPGLFAKNERVSLMTKWQYGNLAFVPVGATCVGSISLGFDPRIRTNRTSSVQNIFSLFRFASGSSGELQNGGEAKNDSEVFSPTEIKRYDYEACQSEDKSSDATPRIARGEELGWFNWGSAIVIIADVPEGCGVQVHPHQDVRVGDPLISW
jgi:phosphatidylserine decarboxylase